MFGVFEASVTSEQEVHLAKQASVDKLSAAVYDVREKLGNALFASTSLEEFRHKVAMMKHDQSLYKIIEAAGVFPNAGTVRRIVGKGGVLEREFKQRLAADDNADSTYGYGPGGDSVPTKATEDALWRRRRERGQKYDWSGGERQRQDDEKMSRPENKGKNWDQEDHGFPRHAADKDPNRPIQDLQQTFQPSEGLLEPEGDFQGYLDSVDQGGPEKVEKHVFASRGLDFAVYTDWCKTKGLSPARLSSLDSYAAHLPDIQYFRLASAIQACNDTGMDWEGTSHHPSTPKGQGKGKLKDVTAGLEGDKYYLDPEPDMDLSRFDPSPGHWTRLRFLNVGEEPGPGETEDEISLPELLELQRRRQHKGSRTAASDDYAECLDGPEGCQGETGYYPALSGSGASYPRCEKHYQEYVDRVQPQMDEIRHRYPDSSSPPDWFDPSYAGETWDDSDEDIPYREGARRTAATCQHCDAEIKQTGPHDLRGDWVDVHSGDPYCEQMSAGGPKDRHHVPREARRRTAAPDYLQKADDALTNLLNQKAEEFQQSVAPLQQALITVQQAEQLQAQQNPMSVLPPAGTVNVLPENGQMPGEGGDLSAPAAGAGLGGGEQAPGGGDLSALLGLGGPGAGPEGGMGGGEGAPPPAAGPEGALPPELMQMQGRRKRGFGDTTNKGYHNCRGCGKTTDTRDLCPTCMLTEHFEKRSPKKAEALRGRTGFRKGAPFAGYENFEDCVSQHQDADDPDAYCGKIKHQVEDGKKKARRRTAEEYSGSGDVQDESGPFAGPHGSFPVGTKKDLNDAKSVCNMPSVKSKHPDTCTSIEKRQSPKQGSYADDLHQKGLEDPNTRSRFEKGHWDRRKPESEEESRKNARRRQATNVMDLWNKWVQSLNTTQRGGESDYEAFAQAYGIGPRAIMKLKRQHGLTAGRHDRPYRNPYSPGDHELGEPDWVPLQQEVRQDFRKEMEALQDAELPEGHPAKHQHGSRQTAGRHTYPVPHVAPQGDGRHEHPQHHAPASHTVPMDDEEYQSYLDEEKYSGGRHETYVGPHHETGLNPDTKAARRQGSRKHGWSGFGPSVFPKTRQVPGWKFDRYLNGYIANQPQRFACKCGKEFDTPTGFHRCKCGAQWNSYVIGTGGGTKEAAAEKFLVREVPVREGVIVANKKPRTVTLINPRSGKKYEMIDPSQEGEDDWPSDHHPARGKATVKEQPSDWHHRDKGKFTPGHSPGPNAFKKKDGAVSSDINKSISDEEKAQRDYARDADEAESEGRDDVADRFREIRRDEVHHEKELRELRGTRRGRRR